MGVLVLRALLFAVYIGAPDFGKLLYGLGPPLKGFELHSG